MLAFFPPSLSVKAGDRVVFRNHSQVEPHTATFAGGASPPQEAVDPLNARPSGESPLVLKPTGFFNTGLVLSSTMPEAASALGGSFEPFTFIVPKAGTYPYSHGLTMPEREQHFGRDLQVLIQGR